MENNAGQGLLHDDLSQRVWQRQRIAARDQSGNALINFKLPMPGVAAVLVIVGWLVAAVIAGAWRTRKRDA